jgi:putative peptide zinc metalloprotease protein
MLAAGALASMLGWPAYRLIKNLRKRGRLPDMKPVRVALSSAVVAGVLLVVFLVPVPISRIKETGLVQVHPMYIAQVHVEVPGQLKKLYVYEGQAVKKDQILAEFTSPELESRRVQAASELEISEKAIQRCDERINEEVDTQEKNRQRDLRAEAEGDRKKAQSKLAQVDQESKRLMLLSPRDGVVLGLPSPEDVGKTWNWNRDIQEKGETTLFCSIGDRSRLRVIVPVASENLQILREDLEQGGAKNYVPVTIRFVGRGMKTWTGKVTTLPPSEAKTVLPALSSKLGGPVAVKPSEDPNHLAPQSQVFLVDVDIDQPDDAMALNTLAQVHMHCRYRSIAWWGWRTIAGSLDLRLM